MNHMNTDYGYSYLSTLLRWSIQITRPSVCCFNLTQKENFTTVRFLDSRAILFWNWSSIEFKQLFWKSVMKVAFLLTRSRFDPRWMEVIKQGIKGVSKLPVVESIEGNRRVQNVTFESKFASASYWILCCVFLYIYFFWLRNTNYNEGEALHNTFGFSIAEYTFVYVYICIYICMYICIYALYSKTFQNLQNVANNCSGTGRNSENRFLLWMLSNLIINAFYFYLYRIIMNSR